MFTLGLKETCGNDVTSFAMAIDCQAQLQLTALAERSGSSIGALYNYFPDKQSIAFTLVNQYAQELEAHWKPMMEQAEILTHAEFADICSSSASPNSPRSVPLI
jgi:hypothetical protein